MSESWTSFRAGSYTVNRFREKRGQLEAFSKLWPESQGQNLASTTLYVPYSLDRSLCEFVEVRSRDERVLDVCPSAVEQTWDT